MGAFGIQDKTARLIGGAAAAGIAVQNALPATGESFALPAFDQSGIFGVYLPFGVAVAALVPGVIPQSKKVAGFGLLVIGGKRVIMDGQTAFTMENVLQGYAPLILGGVLVM